MSLTTTRSTLMHAALAHVSPQLREFDLMAFGNLRLRRSARRRSLASMPTEILLLIRSQLLPVLIAHFIATSAALLQDYETSLRHLICPQCIFYFDFVYGHDVWAWNLSGSCSCAPYHPHTRRPNPKQFRDRHHWLEDHLSLQSLRFKGLSVQSSPRHVAIWDVVKDVLNDFGCEAIRRNPNRPGAGMALLSRWDCQSILVVPLHPTRASQQNSATNGTTQVLLRRLERNLGLSWDYNEPHPKFPAVTSFPASTQAASSEDSIIAVVLLRFLETITAPLSAIFSILLSFVTLLFTVLCYYSKPGALRLF